MEFEILFSFVEDVDIVEFGILFSSVEDAEMEASSELFPTLIPRLILMDLAKTCDRPKPIS